MADLRRSTVNLNPKQQAALERIMKRLDVTQTRALGTAVLLLDSVLDDMDAGKNYVKFEQQTTFFLF